MDWSSRAALFDLDGVLTPTAAVHMHAWDTMFNAFLRERGDERAYSEHDYFSYVDGKPRYDGVRSFLASRHIELPEGEDDDAPDVLTVRGLGNRKNAEFSRILRDEGVRPYGTSVALLDHLAAAGVPVAVVSSSRNAPAVLTAAGLADRFEVVVDGAVAAREGLPGKPAADTFLRAAAMLGVTAAAGVVLEDAISGVEAGRAGGFGTVVGVDRGAGADALRAAGADVVVRELDELIG